MIKGSARSINGFNIYDALKQCEDLLVQFGGHKYAAGLTIEQDQLSKLYRKIPARLPVTCSRNRTSIRNCTLIPNFRLPKSHPRFWKLLKQFEPYWSGQRQTPFREPECDQIRRAAGHRGTRGI
jgi:single-stranded-DNA-specific exonuclease